MEDTIRRTALASLSCLALSQISCAQTSPPAPAAPETPPPPCQEEVYKQFDFWIGDWSVSIPNGTFAGNNKITSEQGGCLILERWTSANGGTGQSYNFYDPAAEKWRQLWVGFGVIIDYEGGLTETGSMRLAGTITYVSNSQTADFIGEWTLNEDGTVTQHFEQYDPENETWNVWFTGIYTREEAETP